MRSPRSVSAFKLLPTLVPGTLYFLFTLNLRSTQSSNMGQKSSKQRKPQNVQPNAPQNAAPITLVGGPQSNRVKPPVDAVVRALGPSHYLAETERNMGGHAIHSLVLYRLVPKIEDAPALERVGGSPKCSVCRKPATLTCSRCRSSRYCSTGCRSEDWPIHEHLCYMYEDFLARPRCADSGHRVIRAVVFPAGSVLPRFAWIKCNLDGSGDNSTSLLGEPPASQGRSRILPKLMAGMARDRSIQVGFREHFDSDGSEPNKSIGEATQGHAPMEWRGNVVAVRYDNAGTSSVHGDMTMEDFRQVVLYLRRATISLT